MRGCVPVSILDHCHLCHSDYSGSILSQGHSDQVNQYMVFRPRIIWHHDNKRWRTVLSGQWQTICSDHIPHKDKRWEILDTVHWQKIVQTIDGQLFKTLHVKRTKSSLRQSNPCSPFYGVTSTNVKFPSKKFDVSSGLGTNLLSYSINSLHTTHTTPDAQAVATTEY